MWFSVAVRWLQLRTAISNLLWFTYFTLPTTGHVLYHLHRIHNRSFSASGPIYFLTLLVVHQLLMSYNRLTCLSFFWLVGSSGLSPLDLVIPSVLSRFGCRSFRVSGPTIWNDLPVDFRSSDITREQFKCSLKSWLFECAYGRRRVWETVPSEGAPKKWTYLLTGTYFSLSRQTKNTPFLQIISTIVFQS